MKGAFHWIAVAWLALSLRGLAPVPSVGGWTSLLPLILLALASCLIPAWRLRRSSSERAASDPGTFLLLAHFPLWAMFYFTLGANHGVDAIDHLEFVRSAVIDRDLDIRNDDAIFGGTPGAIDPGQINMHGVGPAILWAPMYSVAHLLCGVIGQSCNGASRPYLAASTLTSMMLSAWGLVATYRLALLFAPRGPALVSVFGVAWGTFLWWYLTFEPTMSHNLSFAASALAFLLICRAPSRAVGWCFAGAVVGFTASIRFADVLIGAAALPFILAPTGVQKPQEMLKNLAALGLGALVGFAPQMFAWSRIFGAPLVIPHGNDFLDRGAAGIDVLFSPQAGLFTWSPLLLLALPGLLFFRRLGWRAATGLWTAILLIYITNARAYWWAGDGFGGRRFCTILPVLAVGLALSIDALSRAVQRRPLLAPAGLVMAASGWNLLLAEGQRQYAWAWDVPVTFTQMTRVAADLISRGTGSPLALPGALAESIQTGKPLAEYENSKFRRVFSTLTVRFGEDDIPFLKRGFSVPQGQGEGLHRSVREARMEVALHRAEDYRIALVTAGLPGQTLRITVNDVEVAVCGLAAQPNVCEGVASSRAVRTGVNEVEIRVEPVRHDREKARLYTLRLTPERSAPRE